MKIFTSTILVTLIVLCSCTSIVPFGETAVSSIFKEKKDALIFFVDDDGKSVSDVFASAAERDQSGRIYTILDKAVNQDHFKRFSEYLGVNVKETPVLIFIQSASKKYLATPEDLTADGILNFIAKVENGEVKMFLKSAPVPQKNEGPVLTLVGNNFRDVIFGDQREYLVKFYAPWCGHCKKIAPDYLAAAKALASNPNIVLAEFDGSLNEVEGVEISGYPTILWYSIDKQAEPLKYNGDRDEQGFITWIRDHTEYDWIDPVSQQDKKQAEQL